MVNEVEDKYCHPSSDSVLPPHVVMEGPFDESGHCKICLSGSHDCVCEEWNLSLNGKTPMGNTLVSVHHIPFVAEPVSVEDLEDTVVFVSGACLHMSYEFCGMFDDNLHRKDVHPLVFDNQRSFGSSRRTWVNVQSQDS
ncbi:hypothetical protein PILCRDRAFT_12643 [Piloderma croceum F 1598]|uniref:Uncharacterized protein n=1 Tax=Piloderma croceum (strain F 1598) TaxID=765440 RepID=A0A0C3EVR8_PILCF|nr:hypothetical protein PILCRDRAFT_12643 [Piloderma croceum F 1598]